MRIRWRGLELPTKVELDKNVSTDVYGRVYIEPFERGFGTTIGNSLRRVLLSSLEGSAVTCFRLKGADHEYSSLPGVREDVTDIVLNVKSLVVRLDGEGPATLKIDVNKAGVVCAGDIQCDASVEIINKDHVIATLTDDVEFSMEMTVQKGRGYEPVVEREIPAGRELGFIDVDAIYSPVIRVRYNTEQTRVGQKINYDRLVMEIWTDGTIDPEMALVESAKILRKHLVPFVSYFDLGRDVAEVPEEPEEQADDVVVDDKLQQKLDMPITDLKLSVRANNSLEMAGIGTVGQLVAMNESELLSLRNFGKTTMREVKRKLADLGLTIGSAPEPEE